MNILLSLKEELMTMSGSADETFNALRRWPFHDVRREIINLSCDHLAYATLDYVHDQFVKSMVSEQANSILKKARWTLGEYQKSVEQHSHRRVKHLGY
jgi:hypothetical protein